MKIGDRVLIKASVFTKKRVNSQGWNYTIENVTNHTYENSFKGSIYAPSKNRCVPRNLKRINYEEPFYGIVIGWSTRISGYYVIGDHDWGDDYSSPGYIANQQTHKVIMVVAEQDNQRFSQPFPCLESDLVLDKEVDTTVKFEKRQIMIFEGIDNNGGDYIHLELLPDAYDLGQEIYIELGQSCVREESCIMPVSMLVDLILKSDEYKTVEKLEWQYG